MCNFLNYRKKFPRSGELQGFKFPESLDSSDPIQMEFARKNVAPHKLIMLSDTVENDADETEDRWAVLLKYGPKILEGPDGEKALISGLLEHEVDQCVNDLMNDVDGGYFDEGLRKTLNNWDNAEMILA